MRLLKKLPDPAIMDALQRQHWLTTDHLSERTGFPPGTISARLKLMVLNGTVHRMQNDQGRWVYRKAH